MTISQYLEKINTRFKTGISREHTYRGDLQTLLENIVIDVLVTNEPARIACGAPDYILTKKDIPVGYIEAKDIGVDLKSKSLKEQFVRYRAALDNLIITDYLDFHFYVNGELKTTIQIAEIKDGQIVPLPENFASFETLIKDFCLHIGQTIKSSKKLAEMMAAKAKLLADVIEKAINSDEETQENSSIKEQMNAFKEILIHDIKAKEFADIYAQTIAYGMFSARLHDPSLPTFTRQEAAELIPKTNPFLRKLFQYIAGYDLDSRLIWIVDSLADIFRATDIKALLKNFGKATQTHDPIIHFYETFLSEYDPKLRKARGVWYTPEPVVNFIVRAVDDILKTEFDLPQGLADTSKTRIKIATQNFDKKTGKYVEEEREVHKVQILDPATGTGTFLAEVVKHIYKNFEGQQGIWSNYLENHLIPRLNGFELLMASYAMAHLKLDLLMTETGYKPTRDQRFRIYLTNSLEEHHADTGALFANWLSTEANEANHIKRDTPVMVVMGNPPYSGESANKGEWIMKLMEDYKKEPGGKEKLKERNPKWINDDYVKFIRYGQRFIEKNGSGILAFINPHGFLDNPTFRGMRWNLLKTYDKIYTIDLHGNSKKKETAPDGSVDENVFDIQQGVSINLFVKTGKQKRNEFAQVFHFDLFGKREVKYDFLNENSIKSIPYKEIFNKASMYFMVQKDFDVEEVYNKGFNITELFPLNSVGVVTARDNFTIHDSKEELKSTIEDFLNLDDEVARLKFNLGKDVRDWQVNFAKKDLNKYYPEKGNFVKISYRPFDDKWTYYTGKSKGFHCYPRNEVMKHFLNGKGLGLVFEKIMMNKVKDYKDIFITKGIYDAHFIGSASYSFPLYLYREIEDKLYIGTSITRTPNLNPEIVNQIARNLGLRFTNEKEELEDIPENASPVCYANSDEVTEDFKIEKPTPTFAPIDILDYIYAVLHSPTYREKYKEFLKIDFPRVPYPEDTTTFWKLVKLGGELRQIHLL
ncbi:MAG: type ISP restriction/modification enzyme, partial [Ginsengibacter sp.]